MTEEQRAWRAARLMEIDLCDLCQRQAHCLHEISRGVNRMASLTEPACQLVLCAECHSGTVHRGMPVAEQLAWLRFRRVLDYDLRKYWAVTGRRMPDDSEVVACLAEIQRSEM